MDQVHSVEELLQRVAERGMPLEKMRFFINEDRHEPRCFGIYQDEFTGHWIVYKNKADGSRAVRYAGPDEAYAAQELWSKINSEIELRRAAQPAAHAPSRRQAGALAAVIVAAALILGIAVYTEAKKPSRGYYVYDDDILYYQNDIWYCFGGDDWSPYDAPAGNEWYEDAWYGSDYPFEDDDSAFLHSDYYEEPDSRSSDDSAIFDSWDSGGTNWSSDW